MSERLRPSSSVTRRDVVKGAVALAAFGLGSVLESGAAAASRGARPTGGRPRSGRGRVAIIGAGAGGVAATYFLSDTHDVDLFEARSKGLRAVPRRRVERAAARWAQADAHAARLRAPRDVAERV